MTALSAGCTTTGYYWQAVRGHLDVMSRRRPIAEVIADRTTPAQLKDRLVTVQSLRAYASTSLALPDNGSYRNYAALDRPFVAWNVFAADPLAIRPREWCFPIAGCVAYHGYFQRSDAESEAERLRAAGDDVYVGGVPAYSTLGWQDDPVLSTFVRWPEVELARLLFHELAHQVAYAPGDTAFNEAFASAVEEEGVRRWIAQAGRSDLQDAWQQSQRHRQEFQQLALGVRSDLEILYTQDLPRNDKLRAKAERLRRLQSEYQLRRQAWGGFAGYDRWFASGVNNAQLASLAVYAQWVPAFQVLLADEGGDLPRFYRRVGALARLGDGERQNALRAALARALSPAADPAQIPARGPAAASAAVSQPGPVAAH
jgi:predicted aminopeptidase